MTTQEEKDRDAKRKAREARSSGTISSSSRRESSDQDRREKDRARRERDGASAATPGAHASNDDPARRKSRRSSSDAIDRSDRSGSERQSSSRTSGKSRTSRPATTPGAVSSSETSPSARRERRKAGQESSGTSSRSSNGDRSSGKIRIHRPATTPGAVTSTSSPHSRKERRKMGQSPGSSRSTVAQNAAVQNNVQAAGLFDEEEGKEEVPSKSGEIEKNPEGEILLQAMAVDESVPNPPLPVLAQVPISGPPHSQDKAPPSQEEPKKRRNGPIILALLVLGAGAGAGAYFGTRKSSSPAVAPPSTSSPTVAQITPAPTTSAPTDPPTEALKYIQPSQEDCFKIQFGLGRESDSKIYRRYHEVMMDVELSSGASEPDLEALAKAMQQWLMPALAGCSDIVVRDTRIRYVVLYGAVSLETNMGNSLCVDEYPGTCRVVVASLAIELQGQEQRDDVNDLIKDVLDFQGTNGLVSAWELDSGFANVVVTEVKYSDRTDAPSAFPTGMDSVPPTSAPVIGVTDEPTSLATPPPTKTPSVATSPTKVPTKFPSPAPSKNPTVAPAIGPTTNEPTNSPSKVPTKTPTTAPSHPPTQSPTPLPTTPSPTETAATPDPTSLPTTPPTIGPFGGDHLVNDHYVYYMPDDLPPGWPNYPYNSREEGQAACESKGLTLCPVSAITGFEQCAVGWLSDGQGFFLTEPQPGCGGGGYLDASGFSNGGAYCCARPLYIPEDVAPGCCDPYIYSSRDEARAACQSRGLGLCSQEQITGYSLCSFGWLSDGRGLWVREAVPGCAGSGFIESNAADFQSIGAYCCVEQPPTPAPTLPPSLPPTPPPTTPPPTVSPSDNPSSNPTFELMEGDHLIGEHYVIYLGNSYSSREAGRAACEARGVELCSKSAITNFERCAAGWLTDGAGWWMNYVANTAICGSIGYNAATWASEDQLVIGAYCCGRPIWTGGGYVYTTREQGEAGCQSIGRTLCSKSQIQGNENCQYGWLTDGDGLWMNQGRPGCGPDGYHDNPFPYSGAYCCAQP